MTTPLFGLLDDDLELAIRVVLLHWMLGYFHPYSVGNGRIARFLMYVLLASGGYPWMVIQMQDRAECMSALEAASVSGDVSLFARFIAARLGA
ncbi:MULTISPECIES: Fic family protein [Ruegeria]|uniref:Fic family protein n=1 Tax=Ruegeria TaxID=97050 RepID=UPI00131F25C5|nr:MULTISPECIES: Fic family protein [Ruegeria]